MIFLDCTFGSGDSLSGTGTSHWHLVLHAAVTPVTVTRTEIGCDEMCAPVRGPAGITFSAHWQFIQMHDLGRACFY